MKVNNKGFSLITTLVLSALAIVFISALIYFVQSGSRATSSLDMYKDSLEVAKGASELLMKGVDEYKVECDFTKANVQSFIEDFNDHLPSYTITIDNFFCEEFYTENSVGELFTFNLIVQRKSSKEKSVISFGYVKNST